MLSSSHVKQLLLCFPPSREGSNFSNLGIKLPLPLRCPSPSSARGVHCSGGKAQEGEVSGQEGAHTAQHHSLQWHPDSLAALPAAGGAAGSEGGPLSPICTKTSLRQRASLGSHRQGVCAGWQLQPSQVTTHPAEPGSCLHPTQKLGGQAGKERRGKQP